MKLSIVVGAPTAMLMLDRFRFAPDDPIDPSKRGSEVDALSSSTPLPLNLNQPAVPVAIPTKLHVPDFDTDPPDADAKVRPLVGDPGVKGPDASVTMPRRTPDTALSADAGCEPERISMIPLANVDAKPVVPARFVRSPVERRIVMVAP